MSDATRSERACPVCGQHRLALEEAPHIDVMGVQTYSDILGMGDLQQSTLPGIVCLACGTHWRDLAAFEANDAEPAGEQTAASGGAPDDPAAAERPDDPGSLDGADDLGRPHATSPSDRS